MARILVTGALGQIGSELVPELRRRFDAEAVIASDIRRPTASGNADAGPFEHLDCTSIQQVRDVVRRHGER